MILDAKVVSMMMNMLVELATSGWTPIEIWSGLKMVPPPRPNVTPSQELKRAPARSV